jgi:polyhydroxyalkanoate synthase
MLRSRELLWAPIIDTYIRGKREPLGDIMAWNADGTRMPARMHTEYLYRLYLDNELGRGTYTVGGKPAKLDAITAPMFVVGTESDHVAPWRSVYKARGLTRSTDYTFLLTSGGHNAGIISGPVHPKRRYKQLAWRDAATTLSPDEWQTTAEQHPGSWWPAWEEWLVAHSSTARVAPPRVGNPDKGLAPLGKAPGEYVRMK